MEHCGGALFHLISNPHFSDHWSLRMKIGSQKANTELLQETILVFCRTSRSLSNFFQAALSFCLPWCLISSLRAESVHYVLCKVVLRLPCDIWCFYIFPLWLIWGNDSHCCWNSITDVCWRHLILASIQSQSRCCLQWGIYSWRWGYQCWRCPAC